VFIIQWINRLDFVINELCNMLVEKWIFLYLFDKFHILKKENTFAEYAKYLALKNAASFWRYSFVIGLA